MYTQTPNMVTGAVLVLMESTATAELMKSFVRALKLVVVKTFSKNSQNGLFTFKFHILNHMEDYINRFCILHSLDPSPLDNFIFGINQEYRTYVTNTCHENDGDS